MKDPSFSLYEFRKWISSQKRNSNFSLNPRLKPGDGVIVRLSLENMNAKLYPINEDKKNFSEICDALKENGAVIEKFNKSNAQIRVLGINENIIVPKLFLRKKTKN